MNPRYACCRLKLAWAAVAAVVVVLLPAPVPPAIAQTSVPIVQARPETGSRIRRPLVQMYIDAEKPYAQLTPEQRAKFRAHFAGLADADEPPYPEDGLRPVVDTLAFVLADALLEKLGGDSMEEIGPRLSGTAGDERAVEYLAVDSGSTDGTLDAVGTDHCPFMMSDKRAGFSDFRLIPGGAGGVEHRLALLYTYGFLTKRLNINQMVNLFSAQPANIFGLSARKGHIMPGADADLVIWNPEPESIISAVNHHQNCDTNIYEGNRVKGMAEYVIINGRVVIEKGQMTGAAEPGKYLYRTIYRSTDSFSVPFD